MKFIVKIYDLIGWNLIMIISKSLLHLFLKLSCWPDMDYGPFEMEFDFDDLRSQYE